jgi:CheY-like chemotaxis protein
MNETVKIPAGTKIFLVEDDAFISSLLVKKFEGDGAVIVTGATGENAAASIKTEKPAVIILDIMLPGVDGFQVLQQIKSDAETKDIPVIMLSNLSEKVQIEKAKKYGAVSFLIKATLSVDEIVGEVAKQLKIETMTRG